MAIPYLACMALAASFYHLPPRVLPSIQAVEGGQVGLISDNKNQTQDLGVMQINTIWVYPLAKYTSLPTEAVRNRLIDDACFNIAAAALIVRVYLNEVHGDLLRAIGNFHSHTTALNTIYQNKVIKSAQKLFQSPK